MCEGLIVCMFFTVLFAGVVHMSRSMGSKVDAMSLARGCAWQYADSGCKSLPARCSAVTTAVGVAESNAGAEATSEIAKVAKGLKKPAGFVHDLLSKLHVIGEATSLQASRTIIRPAPLGAGSIQVVGHYSLLCNERARTPLELVQDAFCSAVKIGC